MKKIRTGLTFEPWVGDTLSKIAEENNFTLAPPHAARAGREWDWAAAVRYLAEGYSGAGDVVDETLDRVSEWLDRELSRGGGRCRYRGGVLSIEIGGKVHEFTP